MKFLVLWFSRLSSVYSLTFGDKPHRMLKITEQRSRHLQGESRSCTYDISHYAIFSTLVLFLLKQTQLSVQDTFNNPSRISTLSQVRFYSLERISGRLEGGANRPCASSASSSTAMSSSPSRISSRRRLGWRQHPLPGRLHATAIWWYSHVTLKQVRAWHFVLLCFVHGLQWT
jgi:hypothetical protein